MDFKIPKEFQLFGQIIKIVWDEKMINNSDNVGESRYRDNDIALQPASKAIPRKREQEEKDFFHELVHFIYHYIGEPELRDNEKLVDRFACLLHQAIKTMK